MTMITIASRRGLTCSSRWRSPFALSPTGSLASITSAWSSVDPLLPDDVIIGVSDNARALFSAERMPGHCSQRNDWVSHKRCLSPRIPDHLIETRQATTGSRFYAVKLQEGEQPLEQEEEQLEQGLEQPLEEEAATGADAAAAAAEPATGAAEPATGADGDADVSSLLRRKIWPR